MTDLAKFYAVDETLLKLMVNYFKSRDMLEVFSILEKILEEGDLSKVGVESLLFRFLESQSYYEVSEEGGKEVYSWNVRLLPDLEGELVGFREYLSVLILGRKGNETIH